MKHAYLTGLLTALLVWPLAAFSHGAHSSHTSHSLNGFSLDNALVPVDSIQRGGPPADGIPAIDEPVFLKAKDADYLRPDDRVLGIEMKGQARAYPLRILNWHELVNDEISGQPFVISYCPLCGSGMAFKSVPDTGREGNNGDVPLSFGVSGLLYNSDVLMFDRETGSLWSQIRGQAVTGKLAGAKLDQIPLTLTLWSDWLRKHPDSQVLSTETGFNRNYNRDPYAGYGDNGAIYFPVANQAPEDYHPKEMVLGFKGSGSAVAFPFTELSRNNQSEIIYEFEENKYTVHWDSANKSAWITDHNGQTLPSTLLFWFAWYAFYPDTQVYRAPDS